tara:strand:+ start:586 stop:1002 length:417 start_codon:yes stop_codon:yes gene_type:complete
MNYEDAKRLMGTARNKDKGKPLDKANTRLHEVNDSAYMHPVYEIRLHGNTIIRLISINTVTLYELSSCGWRTLTTKQRLNHYTPFRVYQKDWDWFIQIIQPRGNKTYEFVDKMIVHQMTDNLHHVFVNGKRMGGTRND